MFNKQRRETEHDILRYNWNSNTHHGRRESQLGVRTGVSGVQVLVVVKMKLVV